MDDDTVTFLVKDYRNEGQWKELTISGVEFVRRFLMHVPPRRFVRIRHYGLLCSRTKSQKLTLAEIYLDVRSIFQSFVTWKCLKYWNIFMASKFVCVRHVVGISESHRWECHCAAKEQHLILSKASVSEVLSSCPFACFYKCCSFHTENHI